MNQCTAPGRPVTARTEVTDQPDLCLFGARRPITSGLTERIRAAAATRQLSRSANGQGVEVLLQGTGDDKHDKDRLHLDLRTAGLKREVERIVGLGPSMLTDHLVIGHRWRWHILA